MSNANGWFPLNQRNRLKKREELAKKKRKESVRRKKGLDKKKKLEKLKREQEINDRLSRKLSEECGSMVSQSSSKSLADILREKLILPDDGDGDQSILDDHVSRVWTDKTPLRFVAI